MTERNVYILGLFVFINTSILVRKTWDALHTKNMFAAFPLFIANADKIQKCKIEWFSDTKKLLLLTLWQRPQEHFNRHPLFWHPYTPTFDVIPYTLKTIESYFPGLARLGTRKTGLNPPVFLYWPFQGSTSVVVPYCYLFLLSVFILWFSHYVSDIFCKF